MGFQFESDNECVIWFLYFGNKKQLKKSFLNGEDMGYIFESLFYLKVVIVVFVMMMMFIGGKKLYWSKYIIDIMLIFIVFDNVEVVVLLWSLFFFVSRKSVD